MCLYGAKGLRAIDSAEPKLPAAPAKVGGSGYEQRYRQYPADSHKPLHLKIKLHDVGFKVCMFSLCIKMWSSFTRRSYFSLSGTTEGVMGEKEKSMLFT